MKTSSTFLLCVLLLAFLSACASVPTATPAPTATALPTSTPPRTATLIPAATATATNTATPLPTATATATRTETPKPTATATITLTPTPAAETKIFVDDALNERFAALQGKLPEWTSGMVSYPALGGKGAPATFAEVVGQSKLPGAGSNWYEVKNPDLNGPVWSCIVNVMPEKVPAGMRPGTPIHVFLLSRNGSLVEAVDIGEVINPGDWNKMIGKRLFFMVSNYSPENNGKIFEVNSYDSPMLGIGIWK